MLNDTRPRTSASQLIWDALKMCACVMGVG
jgi:hypothetical protein